MQAERMARSLLKEQHRGARWGEGLNILSTIGKYPIIYDENIFYNGNWKDLNSFQKKRLAEFKKIGYKQLKKGLNLLPTKAIIAEDGQVFLPKTERESLETLSIRECTVSLEQLVLVDGAVFIIGGYFFGSAMTENQFRYYDKYQR